MKLADDDELKLRASCDGFVSCKILLGASVDRQLGTGLYSVYID
jgi:hypothetical protein